jgi:UDP-N-acetylglucosamine:LPS N-acetylglucosamine transferase
VAEIDKILSSNQKLSQMKENALNFSSPLAAEKIAQSAIEIALTHEQ